jgi:hypothetical protein
LDHISDFAKRYAMIHDPALSNQVKIYIMVLLLTLYSKQPSGTYPPYETGLKLDIYVKDSLGNPYVGQVWPGVSMTQRVVNDF